METSDPNPESEEPLMHGAGRTATSLSTREWERILREELGRNGLGRKPRMYEFNDHAAVARHKLASVLLGLGDGFVHFGRYLTGRPDCFAPRDCLALARQLELAGNEPVPGFAGPGPGFSTVREMKRREPFRIFRANHKESGIPVRIQMIDRDYCEIRRKQEPTFALLQNALLALNPQLDAGALLSDYRNFSLKEMDLIADATWLERFWNKETPGDAIAVAKPLKNSCDEELLVTVREAGNSLDELIANTGNKGQSDFGGREALARRICLGWFHQILRGDWFPLRPDLRDFVLHPDGGLLCVGGPAVLPGQEFQKAMIDYLMAVASDNPDHAYHALCSQMDADREPAADFRHRFRQVVPFRDGPMRREGNAETLAEHIFVQWRFAYESGFRPNSQLLDFYHSFSHLVFLVTDLAPEGDPIREALYEVRLKMGLVEFRKMTDLGHLTGQAESMLEMVTDLPVNMESYLRQTEPAWQRSQKSIKEKSNSGGPVAAGFSLILVMIALAMLTRHYADVYPWAESLGGICFIVVGGLLLRALTRNS